jgi:hypothetical protein
MTVLSALLSTSGGGTATSVAATSRPTADLQADIATWSSKMKSRTGYFRDAVIAPGDGRSVDLYATDVTRLRRAARAAPWFKKADTVRFYTTKFSARTVSKSLSTLTSRSFRAEVQKKFDANLSAALIDSTASVIEVQSDFAPCGLETYLRSHSEVPLYVTVSTDHGYGVG